jgi:hypothetical protein
MEQRVGLHGFNSSPYIWWNQPVVEQFLIKVHPGGGGVPAQTGPAL